MSEVVGREVAPFRKFKIYRHLLNTDLILYHRFLNRVNSSQSPADLFTVNNISAEMAVLGQVIKLLQYHLQVYEGPFDLTDKSLTYQ